MTLPEPPPANHYRVEHGPSLRDQFALAALPAAMTIYQEHARTECLKGGNGSIHDITADIAYAFADAMMQRREQLTQPTYAPE